MLKTLTIAVLCLLVVAVGFAGQTFAQGGGKKSAASGHGTLLVTDDNGDQTRRQFSFSAMLTGSGTEARGQAILHNPAFTGTTDDKRYYLQVDVTCMNVLSPNSAIIAGFSKRDNDPNLPEGLAFYVEDNGEPGAQGEIRDRITLVNFLQPGISPNLCGQFTLQDFIDNNSAPVVIGGGNIQVRVSTR
jgi:hypothetical protein